MDHHCVQDQVNEANIRRVAKIMKSVNTEELNKVDQHIKMCMLTHPNIFPSRMSVLTHLFIVGGNGYRWTKNGALENPYDGDLKAGNVKMDYSDLDESKKKHENLIAQCGDQKELASQVLAAQRCRIERDYLLRRHIEQNIDTYAKKHVGSENDNPGVNWLKDFAPEYSKFSLSSDGFEKMPEVIEKDWALAGEEIFKIALDAIKREIQFHSPFFKWETADPIWVEKHNQIQNILERLDQFTGTAKRNKELLSIAGVRTDDAMKSKSAPKPT